jgi:hypothetical protein
LEKWLGKSQWNIIMQIANANSEAHKAHYEPKQSKTWISNFKNLSIVLYCAVKADKKKLTKHYVSGTGQITVLRKQLKVHDIFIWTR